MTNSWRVSRSKRPRLWLHHPFSDAFPGAGKFIVTFASLPSCAFAQSKLPSWCLEATPFRFMGHVLQSAPVIHAADHALVLLEARGGSVWFFFSTKKSGSLIAQWLLRSLSQISRLSLSHLHCSLSQISSSFHHTSNSESNGAWPHARQLWQLRKQRTVDKSI